VIGCFDFEGRLVGRWAVVKERVCQGAADALVEQNEHGSDAGPFLGESIAVMLALSLQQTVGFHFTQVIAELIEGVGFRGESEGG